MVHMLVLQLVEGQILPMRDLTRAVLVVLVLVVLILRTQNPPLQSITLVGILSLLLIAGQGQTTDKELQR